jgi:hypothetical protein
MNYEPEQIVNTKESEPKQITIAEKFKLQQINALIEIESRKTTASANLEFFDEKENIDGCRSKQITISIESEPKQNDISTNQN